VKTKSCLKLAYYPNFSRFFGLVQLIFSYQGKLWFLIERLESAEKQRLGRAPWQNRIIPNWAYLRTKANSTSASSLKSRLEVFSLGDIGHVSVITPQARTSYLGLLFDFTGAQLTMIVYRTTMCLAPNRRMSSLETSTAKTEDAVLRCHQRAALGLVPAPCGSGLQSRQVRREHPSDSNTAAACSSSQRPRSFRRHPSATLGTLH